MTDHTRTPQWLLALLLLSLGGLHLQVLRLRLTVEDLAEPVVLPAPPPPPPRVLIAGDARQPEGRG